MTDLTFVEDDPRGSEVPDPRGERQSEQPHERSLKDLERAKYTDEDGPQNGNVRPGNLGNDLFDGRQGQDWKGWA